MEDLEIEVEAILMMISALVASTLGDLIDFLNVVELVVVGFEDAGLEDFLAEVIISTTRRHRSVGGGNHFDETILSVMTIALLSEHGRTAQCHYILRRSVAKAKSTTIQDMLPVHLHQRTTLVAWLQHL